MRIRSIALCAGLVLLGLQLTPARAASAATPCDEAPNGAAARGPDAATTPPRLATALVGREFVYTVQPGDSLTLVSARFGVNLQVLARSNGLSPQAWLQVGQRMRVASFHIAPATLPETGLLINVPQRMLFHFEDGELAGAHPVGLGRPDWPTPRGVYRITSLERDKVWYVPVSIQQEMLANEQVVKTRVEPGPDNPLGGLWLGLDRRGYGIHATTSPQSLYAFRSHGCIRMHREDLELLFASAEVGHEVHIIYRPTLLARAPDGRILLEAHPDAYDLADLPIRELRALATEHALEDEIDWDRVAQMIEVRDGVPREVRRMRAGEE